jgi:hypothetical protein
VVMLQDQRSLIDQLKDLVPLANKHGLYDAADWLSSHLRLRDFNASLRDRVIQRYAYTQVVRPDDVIHRALSSDLLTPEEAHSTKVKAAARDAADSLNEYWPEGEGFGSSDMTSVIKEMLEGAGFRTAYKNNRLVRLDRE